MLFFCFNLGKLIFVLVLFSVIIVLVNILFVSYCVQCDQLVGNMLEVNCVYVIKLVEIIQNFLLVVQQELVYVVIWFGQNDFDLVQVQDEVSWLQLQINSFNFLLVVDVDGLVIVILLQILQLQGEILYSVGNNVVLVVCQLMISDFYQLIIGKLLVLLLYLIFDCSGYYRGYVSGILYLCQCSVLYMLLGKYYYCDGLYLYVVDCNGCLLYYVDGKWVGDYVVGNLVVKVVVCGECGVQQVCNNLGVLMLVGYVLVLVIGWGIIVQWLIEVMLQLLLWLMIVVIWNVILFGLLLLLVIWWFVCCILMLLWQLV